MKKRGRKIGSKFPHTQETKDKISKNNSCYWSGKERPLYVREKIRNSLVNKYIGEKSPNWRGGRKTLPDNIRRLFEYRRWRSEVFTRDSFTCQQCRDNQGRNLEAHHIKRFLKIIEENNVKTIQEALVCEELWNINNGITLCKRCHKKIYTKN